MTFNNWFSSRGLKISASKSTCLIVNKPRNQQMPPPLTIGQDTVPYVTEVKYLGILLDRNLTWKPHIKSRISKAKERPDVCEKIGWGTMGFSPR